MAEAWRWQLPPSPDHRDYQEILALIESEMEREPRSGMAWFAAVAETDLWFFQRYVMSIGQLRINEPGHPRFGSFYADEPWFFDRMREVQHADDNRIDRALWYWFRFSFKDLDIETPVPTPQGWRKHGDLALGDEVFALDGSVTTVTGLSERFEKECYRVSFDDGSEVIAGEGHLWGLEVPSFKRLSKESQVRDRRRYEVWTTRQLAEHPHNPNRRARVPPIEAVQYPKKDLPIDPYVLGAWLGDGSAQDGRVTGVDEQIFEEIEAAGYRVAPPPEGRKHTRTPTRSVYGLFPQLRELGLLHNKHIPEVYMRGDVDQRRALLQGLMDTDGTITGRKNQRARATFVTICPELAEQVAELVASLGIKAKKYSYENGHAGMWYVSFGPNLDDKVFRLKRKLDRCTENDRRHWRSVVKVEPIGVRKSSCIRIAHPSALYLVTKRFIPTHNTTTITKGATLWRLARNPLCATAVFTHKIDQSGENMGQDFLTEIQKNEILRAHWPQFRSLSEATPTRMTVDRPAGPREPSISLYPIGSSATSGHFTYIMVDDAVTDKIIDSPEQLKRVDNQISRLAPLQHDDTLTWFVGTPWGKGDPVWERERKRKYFHYVSRQPGLLPGNVAQLRTAAYFMKLRDSMLDHDFEAQIRLRIVPRGEQYFHEHWLRYYQGTPEQAARGCRIHAIIDSAEGTGEDFTAVAIFATTADKRRRVLDLWREKMGMVELWDLLLGPEEGEENLSENLWKPAKGVLWRWHQIDPELTIWFEPYRSNDLMASFRKEMKRRKRPYRAQFLPRPKMEGAKKKKRISLLQPDFRNGVFEYPSTGGKEGAPGFGHCSYAGSTPDQRDTFDQFVKDEYTVWTFDGEADNDDQLDVHAWTCQPGVQLACPAPVETEEYPDRWKHRGQEEASYRQASWRVQ